MKSMRLQIINNKRLFLGGTWMTNKQISYLPQVKGEIQ